MTRTRLWHRQGREGQRRQGEGPQGSQGPEGRRERHADDREEGRQGDSHGDQKHPKGQIVRVTGGRGRGQGHPGVRDVPVPFFRRRWIMRVLVIDKHRRLAWYLKRGLEAEGFAVDTACDGDEGGYKAQSADYDAIVLNP